jgi:hypothetical protein
VINVRDSLEDDDFDPVPRVVCKTGTSAARAPAADSNTNAQAILCCRLMPMRPSGFSVFQAFEQIGDALESGVDAVELRGYATACRLRAVAVRLALRRRTSATSTRVSPQFDTPAGRPEIDPRSSAAAVRRSSVILKCPAAAAPSGR